MANVDEQPPYRNSSIPVDQRVDDLLDRMTISEKVGQLVGTWAGELSSTKDLDDVEQEIVEHGVGAVASFGWAGARDLRLDDVVETVNCLQEVARSETRLGIPLLFNVDAVHGHAYVTEGTAFPNGLGMAATWDERLTESGAAVTAREVRASGAHQNYSPTCDVARDPRWGRTFETFGESPYLCGKLAAAKVRGYQGDGIEADESVIATAKHFPAYSEPVRGEDASPVETSEYLLRNVFTPSFVDALEEDVESVMPCYNAIDGQPAHGSQQLLTEFLRDDLGFDGTVVSDWHGVEMLHENHRVTADHRDSVRLTRQAGLDIASVDAIDHARHLQSLVEAGDLSESVVDESVRRVLEQKFRLGLFEDPFVDAETATEVVGSDEHRDQALDAARESMTLLSNDGTLPLDDETDVLVAGPNADDPRNQLGGWSVTDTEGADIVTIREGIESLAGGDVTYERGSGIDEPDDIVAAPPPAAPSRATTRSTGPSTSAPGRFAGSRSVATRWRQPISAAVPYAPWTTIRLALPHSRKYTPSTTAPTSARLTPPRSTPTATRTIRTGIVTRIESTWRVPSLRSKLRTSRASVPSAVAVWSTVRRPSPGTSKSAPQCIHQVALALTFPSQRGQRGSEGIYFHALPVAN
jgi:beta-glucosidase